MKPLHQHLLAIQKTILRHKYLSIALITLCVMVSVAGVIVAATHDTPPTKPATTVSTTTPKVQGATNTPAAMPTPATDQPATTPATANTTKPAAAPAASKRQLKISPAAITVKAGEASANITVQADDGKAINMPMFTTRPIDLVANFPAGPAKPIWTGPFLTIPTTKPGTYTVEIGAQDVKAGWYKGTLTITILPTPTMTVSVQQTEYNAEYDALVFTLTVNRLNGYGQPIERYYATDPKNAFVCPFEQISEDTFLIGCAHAAGDRPTTGTLYVNVFTTSDVFSGSTSFTLPPKP
jgi:hypothetical protein